MVACQIDQRHATRSGVCLADLLCASAPVEPIQTHTDRREPAIPIRRSHGRPLHCWHLRLGNMVLAHKGTCSSRISTDKGAPSRLAHAAVRPSTQRTIVSPTPPHPTRAPHRPSPGAVGILDNRARHRPSGSMRRAHLVRTVELVVHEARNDGGLADALISEEHQFILC